MSDDGPGTREVAHRVFAAEFDDASLSYSESDEERAPNYVVTPTGARVNRLFVAGVLTEVERVNDDTSRGRVVDPSGAFVTYAGQYQPDEQAFLSRTEPPAFVALTGKARTFEPEDGDRVFTSVRPERLSEVDAATRDRWVVSAAEATLDRLAVVERALESSLRGDDLRDALAAGGVPAALAAGIPLAFDHYGTGSAYVEAVRQLAVDALELVAGERDDVRAPSIEPDAAGAVEIGPLPETDVQVVADATAVATDATTAEKPDTAAVDEAETEASVEPDVSVDEAESVGESGAGVEAAVTESETGASESESESTTPPTELETDAATPEGTGDDTEADSVGSDTIEADDATGMDDSTPVSSTTTNTGSVDTTVTDSTERDADLDELGDFDAGVDDEPTVSEEASTEASATGDDELFQLDDDEREEIEAEFGTDFTTGSEVDEPGAADIDVPGPDEFEDVEASATDAESAAGDSDADTASIGSVDTDADSTATTAEETDTDSTAGEAVEDGASSVDLEDAVVEAMSSLDDGDGADREAVVEQVVSEHGADPDAVEDAVQDALMSGKCYEPGEGVLKAI
jgi:RPA family protein